MSECRPMAIGLLGTESLDVQRETIFFEFFDKLQHTYMYVHPSTQTDPFVQILNNS